MRSHSEAESKRKTEKTVRGMKDILVALDATTTPLPTSAHANPGKEDLAPVDLAEMKCPHEGFQLHRGTSNMDLHHHLPGFGSSKSDAVTAVDVDTDNLTGAESAAEPAKLDAQVSMKPKKAGAWSREEHERYCAALKIHRYGSWKLIASCVGTRTDRQVMSHAQSIREKIKRHERSRQQCQVVDTLSNCPVLEPSIRLASTTRAEKHLVTGQDSVELTERGGQSFEERLIASMESDHASASGRVYTHEHSGESVDDDDKDLFPEFLLQDENWTQ